ncbi:hypothetical protein FT641_20045 [Bacillus paranthracis]|uniref:hypothetical protein n=1 Tax=Bacillus paranthracis TaxID=2026186 RepID=UPI00187A897A|nr:hypothetical protein [Bacillus paranthracis]MBE7114646.1 hypothetical protein [Bacillus paranthracis]MBE7154987.1 hypothetical protein [Bacillus paranthracis]
MTERIKANWERYVAGLVVASIVAVVAGGVIYVCILVGKGVNESMERKEATSRWAASEVHKADTKSYEVKKYSKLEHVGMSLVDTNLDGSVRFPFVGSWDTIEELGNEDVYETDVQYVDAGGQLHTADQKVYVVYSDEVTKPELRVKVLGKDAQVGSLDIEVNPTLYIPNKQ